MSGCGASTRFAACSESAPPSIPPFLSTRPAFSWYTLPFHTYGSLQQSGSITTVKLHRRRSDRRPLAWSVPPDRARPLPVSRSNPTTSPSLALHLSSASRRQSPLTAHPSSSRPDPRCCRRSVANATSELVAGETLRPTPPTTSQTKDPLASRYTIFFTYVSGESISSRAERRWRRRNRGGCGVGRRRRWELDKGSMTLQARAASRKTLTQKPLTLTASSPFSSLQCSTSSPRPARRRPVLDLTSPKPSSRFYETLGHSRAPLPSSLYTSFQRVALALDLRKSGIRLSLPSLSPYYTSRNARKRGRPLLDRIDRNPRTPVSLGLSTKNRSPTPFDLRHLAARSRVDNDPRRPTWPIPSKTQPPQRPPLRVARPAAVVVQPEAVEVVVADPVKDVTATLVPAHVPLPVAAAKTAPVRPSALVVVGVRRLLLRVQVGEVVPHEGPRSPRAPTSEHQPRHRTPPEGPALPKAVLVDAELRKRPRPAAVSGHLLAVKIDSVR